MCMVPSSCFLDIIHAAGMDETYCTYVSDECFGIHDYDDDTRHDTDDNIGDDTDDDTPDDADDDTDDGGRGNLYTIKVFRGWVAGGSPWGG